MTKKKSKPKSKSKEKRKSERKKQRKAKAKPKAKRKSSPESSPTPEPQLAIAAPVTAPATATPATAAPATPAPTPTPTPTQPPTLLPVEHWQNEPEAHDYPAAAAYLSLLHTPNAVKLVVIALKNAPLEHWKAKDLLRASGLPLLPLDNPHVASDLNKVQSGDRLSPVLIVRGDVRRAVPLTVADGYHRVCASYHLDENADIPCHLADFSTP